MLFQLIASAASSLLLTALLTGLLASRRALRLGIDLPRKQSLHDKPVSRLGGIAILVGIVAGVAGLSPLNPDQTIIPTTTAIGLLAIVMVSVLDDLTGAAIWLRFMVHGGAAILVVWPWHESASEGVGAQTDYLLQCLITLLVLFAVVWMTNLYNFMDGADGMAGGMGVIGFAALGCLGIMAGASQFAAGNFIVAAAVAGFLIWNIPPASIFMGDTGSISLGFLAASQVIWGTQQGLFPAEVGLLVFAPFIVDATATLCQRLYRRERVWEPHRGHYYQRLILAGHGARRVLAGYYGLMLAGAGCAVLMAQLGVSMRAVLLGVWGGIYVLLLVFAEKQILRRPVGPK